MMKAAIFLDRDGVICVNRPGYVRSWEEFEFLPGALEAMRRLAEIDWPLVVVSNQSAVGRGLMRAEEVDEINLRMVAQIRAAGGRVDAVYYCPHAPEDECDCRKPKPGLLLKAAADLGLALESSYLVGDAKSDIQAALAVGTRPILVLTGRGKKHIERMGDIDGHFEVADNLLEAVKLILLIAGSNLSRE